MNTRRSFDRYPGLRGVRILVVDDNEICQLIIQSILEDAGIEVELADNGFEALRKLKTIRFDLILMDLYMPTMDGCETAMRIRTSHSCNELPIIAMTTEDNIERCIIEFGMNGYLTKPVNPESVYRALQEHLCR